ncbi:hypothetical protein DRO35_01500 [Candidatus Bathyarchaeota archaeon]|nr:MAG: hypothetical protein DRO35_01500 [Candidatus Bathyarchaeota archaeon]
MDFEILHVILIYSCMLTKVIFLNIKKFCRCLNLSLWKYSFELINKELEVTQRKKKALDDIFVEKKISQSTYDYLKSELDRAISELEHNLTKLKEKMATRAQELESQLSSLELLLASLEIHHAAGDVDDETYEKENKAILLGLEATKRELNDIRDALQGPIVKAAEETKPVEAEKPSTEQEEQAFERGESSAEEQKVSTELSEHTSAVSTPEESKMDAETRAYDANESSWETESQAEY